MLAILIRWISTVAVRLFCKQRVVCSIQTSSTSYALVAQGIEHLATNQGVGSSILSKRAICRAAKSASGRRYRSRRKSG